MCINIYSYLHGDIITFSYIYVLNLARARLSQCECTYTYVSACSSLFNIAESIPYIYDLFTFAIPIFIIRLCLSFTLLPNALTLFFYLIPLFRQFLGCLSRFLVYYYRSMQPLCNIILRVSIIERSYKRRNKPISHIFIHVQYEEVVSHICLFT